MQEDQVFTYPAQPSDNWINSILSRSLPSEVLTFESTDERLEEMDGKWIKITFENERDFEGLLCITDRQRCVRFIPDGKGQEEGRIEQLVRLSVRVDSDPRLRDLG
jgi:hypothetical protein